MIQRQRRLIEARNGPMMKPTIPFSDSFSTFHRFVRDNYRLRTSFDRKMSPVGQMPMGYLVHSKVRMRLSQWAEYSLTYRKHPCFTPLLKENRKAPTL